MTTPFNLQDYAELIDSINPPRVPPGYRQLGPDEFVEEGDIYWHTSRCRWEPYNAKPGNPIRIYQWPMARKES